MSEAAQTPASPIVVTCALIERDGRLLVAQRPPQKHLPLKWEFPGGKVENGESLAAALMRELREELGIEVAIGAEQPAVVHTYERFTIRLVPFCCVITSGEPQPHEHVAVRWCSLDEIEGLELAPADRPVLVNYRVACSPRDAGR